MPLRATTRIGVDVGDRARLERRRDALQRGDLDRAAVVRMRARAAHRSQRSARRGATPGRPARRLGGRSGHPITATRPPSAETTRSDACHSERGPVVPNGDTTTWIARGGTDAGSNVARQRSFEHDIRRREQAPRRMRPRAYRRGGARTQRACVRSADPPGGSTSTTSAPISQSSRPACAVRGLSYSRTRSPSSGFTRCASPTPARSRARDGRCRARHRDGRRSSAPRAARRRAQRGRTSRGIRSG